MVDDALFVTTLCWGITAACALSVAVPQTWLLLRTVLRRDDLWWFRLKTSLLFSTISLGATRNVLIWADYAYFDQQILGPFAHRWLFDLTVTVLFTLGVALAAVLYAQTQREGRAP